MQHSGAFERFVVKHYVKLFSILTERRIYNNRSQTYPYLKKSHGPLNKKKYTKLYCNPGHLEVLLGLQQNIFLFWYQFFRSSINNLMHKKRWAKKVTRILTDYRRFFCYFIIILRRRRSRKILFSYWLSIWIFKVF